jgi:hypothetical protein
VPGSPYEDWFAPEYLLRFALRQWRRFQELPEAGNFIAVHIDFVRLHVKLDQIRCAETRGDRHVDRVSSRRHEDPSEAWIIVACIEVHPLAFEKDLIPGAKIPGSTIRLADVADIARHVARWYIHATTKSNREVLKVSADADSLYEHVCRGFSRSGGVVVESYAFMDPIPEGDGALPPGFRGRTGISIPRTFIRCRLFFEKGSPRP